jgi:hypothetical protein
MEKQESKNRFPTFPQPRRLPSTFSYGIRILGARPSGPPCCNPLAILASVHNLTLAAHPKPLDKRLPARASFEALELDLICRRIPGWPGRAFYKERREGSGPGLCFVSGFLINVSPGRLTVVTGSRDTGWSVAFTQVSYKGELLTALYLTRIATWNSRTCRHRRSAMGPAGEKDPHSLTSSVSSGSTSFGPAIQA